MIETEFEMGRSCMKQKYSGTWLRSLLQVITEQEQKGEAVMSRDFLSQVIRSYDKVVPEFASGYLEESMKFFMAGQKSLREEEHEHRMGEGGEVALVRLRREVRPGTHERSPCDTGR